VYAAGARIAVNEDLAAGLKLWKNPFHAAGGETSEARDPRDGGPGVLAVRIRRVRDGSHD
jgi:hypothetical protein